MSNFWKEVREPLSFFVGGLTLSQQLLMATEVNPYVIALVAALMGLPGILGIDALFQRRPTSAETSDIILPMPSENGHSPHQRSSSSSSSSSSGE